MQSWILTLDSLYMQSWILTLDYVYAVMDTHFILYIYAVMDTHFRFFICSHGYRCNRLRCPLARMSGLQCFNMGHNGHGINLYGVSMTLMGN